MTRRILSLTILMFVFTAFAYSQTVEDIIAKSIKATGGQEKFDKIKTIKMTGKMDMMGMAMTFTTYTKKPAFRMEQEVMGSKIISAYDGKKGWMVNPMGGSNEPQEIPENMLGAVKSQADFGSNPLTSMKENGITASYVGKETAEGKDCFKIKMVDKDKKESFLYIDANSYLAVKMKSSTEVMGQQKDIDMVFKEYKAFDGITMATVMEMKTDGQSLTFTFENFEINKPIDDSLFIMPTK